MGNLMQKNILHREKQYEIIINSLDEKKVYIVSALSGSGKSTFFLNLLDMNDFKYLYLAFSEGDADPISFFTKFYKKIKHIEPYITLPTISVELLFNTKIFAMRFFEELINKLKNIQYIVGKVIYGSICLIFL
jgi:ATP/maltotriose-dependent transcriptional regulator MalT